MCLSGYVFVLRVLLICRWIEFLLSLVLFDGEKNKNGVEISGRGGGKMAMRECEPSFVTDFNAYIVYDSCISKRIQLRVTPSAFNIFFLIEWKRGI